MSTPTTAPEGVLIPALPDKTEDKKNADAMVLAAKAFEIKTNDDYVKAGEAVRSIAAAIDTIEKKIEPIKKPAHEAHKNACALEKELKSPYEEAGTIYRGKMGDYSRKLEQARREQEAAAQKAADEEARRQRDAEAQRILDEAAAAELDGDTLGAESLLAEAENVAVAPVYSAPVTLPSSKPKVSGVSERENWKFEVTDLMALVKAVAEGKVPILALQANTVYLGQQARSNKDLLKWPGVRVYNDVGIAVRK